MTAEYRPDPEPQPHEVPWTVADAIFVGLLWLVAIIFVGGAILLGLQSLFEDAQADAITLPVTTVLLIAMTTIYVRVRYPGAVRLLFGPVPPSWRAVGYGIAGGVVAVTLIGFGLGWLLDFIARSIGGELPAVQENFRDIAGDTSAAPMLVLGSVLFAPVAEELFYRGMLFTALRRRLPLWPAMGVSSALWALNHVQTSLEGYLLVMLIIIPLGLLLAWVYHRKGSLVVPIVAHATFNLIQVIVLIMQES